MESILNNRPALAAEINKVAEVAGYLWQKDGLSATEEILPSTLQNMLTMQ